MDIASTVAGNPNSHVGNISPNETPSLPIGIVKEIGQTKYIVAIDSANFYTDHAEFSAYMALDFPGATRKLAFAARKINFNPKGVLFGNGARLELVSEHIINLGPKVELYLPSDGTCYIEFDCNGYKMVHLNGEFRFKNSFIRPPNSTNPDDQVIANFEVHVEDLNNVMITTSITPFEINGLNDFVFNVNSATVDLSDSTNPSGVTLPIAAQSEFAGDLDLWRGFHIQSFIVELPEKLSKRDGNVTIAGNNLFIDKSGVTGEILASNLFSKEQADMASWGYSLDEIKLNLQSNNLTEGSFKGQIEVPPLDNTTFNYSALIQKTDTSFLNYNFVIDLDNTVSIPMSAFKSTLKLNASSSIVVQNNEENKWEPKATLNGTIEHNSTKGALKGIQFQNLTFITEAPYVTGGQFSLVSSGSTSGETNKLGNYPISISYIAFGLNTSNNPVLDVNVGLNLGDGNATNFSVDAGFTVEGKITPVPIANSPLTTQTWSLEKVSVTSIHVLAQTSIFYLNGYAIFKDDDPVYGKGFFGNINFAVDGVLPDTLAFAAGFGKLPTYKYWYVDASLPLNATLGTVTLKKLIGGASYHVDPKASTSEVIAEIAKNNSTPSNPVNDLIPYLPNKNTGLRFYAGVGLDLTGNEKTFNADAIITVALNETGGLSMFDFSGQAYFLVKRVDRATNNGNKISGTFGLNYDANNKIFHANVTANAVFASAITADLQVDLHIEPGLWYFKLNEPSNRAVVDIKGLVVANGYFMLGQQLPPIPPPPSQITSLISGNFSNMDDSAIASGNGVATGAQFNLGFDVEKNLTEKIVAYGAGNIGGGFDLTMYQYSPTSYCAEFPGQPHGMNRKRLTGQIYTYMNLSVGARKYKDNGDLKWDHNIINGSLAALLQGNVPKPAYVYGALACNLSICGIVNIGFDVDFEFGDNCTVIG